MFWCLSDPMTCGLTPEPADRLRQHARVIGLGKLDDLDGDGAAGRQVPTAPDLARSPAAQRDIELVAPH